MTDKQRMDWLEQNQSAVFEHDGQVVVTDITGDRYLARTLREAVDAGIKETNK